MLNEITKLKDEITSLINTKKTEDKTAELASEKSVFGSVKFFFWRPSLKNKLQLICLKELNSSVSMVVDSLTNGSENKAENVFLQDTLFTLQAIIYMGQGKGPTGQLDVYYIDKFYPSGGDVYYVTPIANSNSSRTSRIFQKAADNATKMMSAIRARKVHLPKEMSTIYGSTNDSTNDSTNGVAAVQGF